MIKVSVIYALADAQHEINLEIPENFSVIMAIKRSGILERFPEIDILKNPVGIFGRKVLLDAPVHAGDRIEIYRPLQIDPKTARRVRAKRV